jgi:GTPase SAR1 family protein
MDTGGQEIYDSQNRTYYKRADCCLLVYDITREETFNAIENFYINEINNNCKENIIIILLGNKTDLEKDRKISKQKGSELADKYKFFFMETSCEKNHNVADAFETLIIVTNTEMIEKEKLLNVKEKVDIEKKEKDKKNFKIKIEKEEDNNEVNNEVLKINDNSEQVSMKTKKNNANNSNCC